MCGWLNQSTVLFAPASTANCGNNALFVSDVTITDGTVLAPGEAFTKTWRFQNTGTCDWDEKYTIVAVNTDTPAPTASE